MINADFLSRLENLREATPSEAEDAEPLDVTFPLPFPLSQMYAAYDKAQLTGEKCAIMQPTGDAQTYETVTIVDQPCGPGGRCDACFLGAAVDGWQVSVLTPPAGTMGELADAPPVIRPDFGAEGEAGPPGSQDKLHVHEIAEAQKTDPVISWFIEQVVRPASQGRKARVPITPDLHHEAVAMLQGQQHFKLGKGAEFGPHELLLYKDQRAVIPPQFR